MWSTSKWPQNMSSLINDIKRIPLATFLFFLLAFRLQVVNSHLLFLLTGEREGVGPLLRHNEYDRFFVSPGTISPNLVSETFVRNSFAAVAV